jgi:prepilin-type N-terminal cleavage/methylation domain-containing protein
MTRLFRTVRRGFTLVELLVAMSIIVVLTSIVLLVMSNIGERDGTTDAAGLTRQWLMISKARAGRDNAPRGIRLIVDPTKSPPQSPFWVTELQYIEAPLVITPNPTPGQSLSPTLPLSPFAGPAVTLVYTISPGAPYAIPAGTLFPQSLPNPQTSPTQPLGKLCKIVNLDLATASQIIPNSILQLPTIGTWHRITNVINVTSQAPPDPLWPWSTLLDQNPPTKFTVTVLLDQWPDAQLGIEGTFPPAPVGTVTPIANPCFVTYQFGVSAPPRPLFGEPTLQLPKNICIDVTPWNPAPNGPSPGPGAPPPPYFQSPSTVSSFGGDLDILFSPSGIVVPIGVGAQTDGQILLWHRDYTKLRSAPNGNNPLVIVNSVNSWPPPQYDTYPFQNGGVQQLVSIRCKSGALGQFPVLWPNNTGFYNQIAPGIYEDPYTFARNGATSP